MSRGGALPAGDDAVEPHRDGQGPGHGDGDGDAGEETDGEVRQARAPWHFKVIAVGSVVYLGYRAYQGVSWLAHHIH